MANRIRRYKEHSRFFSWCRSNGRSGTPSDWKDYRRYSKLENELGKIFA